MKSITRQDARRLIQQPPDGGRRGVLVAHAGRHKSPAAAAIGDAYREGSGDQGGDEIRPGEERDG